MNCCQRNGMEDGCNQGRLCPERPVRDAPWLFIAFWLICAVDVALIVWLVK